MNITLLLEDFCFQSKHLRGVSHTTIKRYKQGIMNYCRSTNIWEVENITKESVFHFFLLGRSERSWTVPTYRTYYISLKVFFRWCVDHGYMHENPTDTLTVPKREKLLPKRLKKDDAFYLLDTVFNYPYTCDFERHRNHALFSMFIYAGLRKNEALHLHMQDVDIENLSIFIRRGKGNKDRVVPMSITLAHSLSRYLKERAKMHRTCPEFFTSSNRNMGFTEHGLKHLTKRLKEASKIQFSIHKLRHTFASLMIEGGCDIFSLSKMMGHSDIKTTTIYLSASAEHLREQVTKHPMNNVYPVHKTRPINSTFLHR